MKFTEAELCCGTTADKNKVRNYISKLEKENKRLRSDNRAKDQLIQELLDTCEEMGLERVYDS